MLQACFGRLCNGSEAGASAASKKTLFVGVVAPSKLQAVLAANTVVFRDHDMFLMLTLSCRPSTQDRQQLQVLYNERMAKFPMMDKSSGFDPVKILEPTMGAFDTMSLVKPLLAK